jgi:hypothetical protein
VTTPTLPASPASPQGAKPVRQPTDLAHPRDEGVRAERERIVAILAGASAAARRLAGGSFQTTVAREFAAQANALDAAIEAINGRAIR